MKILFFLLVTCVAIMFSSCAPSMYSIHTPDTNTRCNIYGHKLGPKPKKVANIKF